MGYVDSLNLYAYAGNNPVVFHDPYGLCKEESAGFLSDLWKGKYVGTGYGEFALQHYAEGYVGATNWLEKYGNALGMVFSSLWQEETWKPTTIVLITAYALDKTVLNPPPAIPPKPPMEYRHDKPPSKPHYDEKTRRYEPDHWHETDWNWSPEKEKRFPKERYYGPERPPGAPPSME